MTRRLTDGHGRPVPKRLCAAFGATKTIADRLRGLKEWSHQLKRNRDAFDACGIVLPDIRRMILKLQYEILDSLPYLICDCDCDQNCEKCKGKGWLSKKDVSSTNLFVLPDESCVERLRTTTSNSDAS